MLNLDIVKQYNEAFKAKDTQKIRPLIHSNYHFKGPLMEIRGAEEMLSFMQSCPFVCNQQNVKFVTEENKVVQIFDWVVTSPFKGTIPMCEYLELENGQIKSSRLFYDSGAFPKEVLEQMNQKAQLQHAT